MASRFLQEKVRQERMRLKNSFGPQEMKNIAPEVQRNVNSAGAGKRHTTHEDMAQSITASFQAARRANPPTRTYLPWEVSSTSAGEDHTEKYTGTLKTLTERLEAGERELTALKQRYSAAPSEEVRTAYNTRLDGYHRDLETYRTVQKNYDAYRSPQGIQSRAAQLKSRAGDLERDRRARSIALQSSAAELGTAQGEEAVQRALEKVRASYQAYGETQKSIDALKKRTAELETEGVRRSFEPLRQAADFAEKSAYRSTERGEPKFNALTGTYTDTGFGDITYDYINANERARSRQLVNDLGTQTALLGMDQSFLRELEPDEVSLFNYIYAQRGRESAYQYIKSISGDLTYRQRKKSEAEWAAYAREHPVGTSIFSVLESPMKGLSYLGQAADYLADGQIDQNAAYNKFSHLNSAIRNEVSGIVENRWGTAGSFAYQTGMSMGDFLFNAGITGGNQALSLAIMGSGAAADATVSAKDRGLSDGQSFTLGTVAGLAEIMTEKVSLETLLDKTGMDKNVVGYVLKNILAEGSEEVASDIINLTADVLVSRDKSEWAQAVAAYRRQGLSEGASWGRAAADQAAQMGLDFLGGAVSGGIMAGGGAALNAGLNAYDRGQQRSMSRRTDAAQNRAYDAMREHGMFSPQARETTAASLEELGRMQGDRPVVPMNGSAPVGAHSVRPNDTAPMNAAPPVDGSASAKTDVARQGAQATAVKANTSLFNSKILSNLNQARSYFIEYARKNFPASVVNRETGKEIGISRTGLDKFLSGRIGREKYASGFHIPELVETAHKAGEAGNYHPETVGSIPSFEYYDSNVDIDGRQYTAHIRVKNTGVGDKYYGHTISEVDNIEIELPARTSAPEPQGVQPVNAIGNSTSTIPQHTAAVNPGLRLQSAALVDRKTARSLDALGRAARVSVEVLPSIQGLNGLYQNGRVLISADTKLPILAVAKHELTHSFQQSAPEQYRAFRDLAVQARAEDGVLEELQNQIRSEYQAAGLEISEDAILDEIAAEYAQNLMVDENAVRKLAGENRGLLEKLLDGLRALIDRVKSAFTGGEAPPTAEMEQGARLWEAALAQAGQSRTAADGDGQAQYSIKYDQANRPFVTVEEDILAGVDRKDWVRTVKENLRKKFPDGVAVGNNNIRINRQSRQEMTYSQYMKRLYNMDPEMYADKLRATNNSDEILKAAQGWVNEAPLHPRADDIADFARGEVQLRIGGKDYTAQVIVGNRGENGLLLYDVINLAPATIQERTKKAGTEYTANAQDEPRSRGPAPADEMISHPDAEVNPQTGPGQASRKGGEDLRAQVERLARLNRRLKEETQRSGPGRPDREAVGKQARAVLEEYESGYSRARLTDRLEDLYRDFAAHTDGTLYERGKAPNMDQLRETARDIARDIIAESSTETNPLYEEYSELRKELRTRAVAVSDDLKRGMTEAWADFRRQNMGRLRLGNKGTQVDVLYDELSDRFPEFFPEDIISPADQLVRLAEVAEELQSVTENQYEGEFDLNVEYLSGDLLERFYDTPNKPTFADKQAENLARERVRTREAKEKGRDALEQQRERSNERLEAERQRGRETRQKALERQRGQFNDRLEAERQRGRETKQTALERQKAQLEGRHEQEMEKLRAQKEGQLWDQRKQWEQERARDRKAHREAMERQKERLARQDKKIAALQESRKAEQAKRQDSVERDKLLKIARRLDQLKTTGANRETINGLIGDLDLVSRSMSGKTIKEITDEVGTVERLSVDQDTRDKIARFDKVHINDMDIEDVRELTNLLLYTEKEMRKRGEILTPKADSEERSKLLRVARRLDALKMTDATREKIDSYISDLDLVSKSITGKTVTKLTELKAWYEDQKANNPDFIADEVIEKKITRLEKKQIADMDLQDVRDLTDTLLNIENELRTQRRLLDSEDRRDTYRMGQEAAEHIRASKGASKGGVGAVLDRYIVTETLSPERYVRRLTGYEDADPLAARTRDLSRGQRAMFDYKRRAWGLFQKFVDDRRFMSRLTGKKAEAIEITGLGPEGQTTVQITPDMRVSLYLSSLNSDNLRHIAQGGFTVPDMALYRKGDLSEAYARGTTIKLTPSQVRSITSRMTPQELEYANAISRDYFNGMSRQEINRTSEALKGYSIAREENYFPINTDDRFLRQDSPEVKQDGSIEGMGFTKERITNASSPIYLRDASAVLKGAIDQHAMYVGLAIPVRNFHKVYSVTMSGVDAEGNHLSYTGSVKQALESKWGRAATGYIDKMLRDLQPGGRGDAGKWGGFFNKVRSNYAGAVLTLNASVAMKQAASYPTAAAVLGWKPLAKAMGDFGKVDLETINKYTPLLWYRSLGFDGAELGDVSSRKAAMPKALNWVQGIDVETTRKLWKASEYYVQDHNRGLRKGSDPYYRAVADIYNRVIEESQPNYTAMQRPQLLRSENEFLKTIAMFKTQPFQNANILYDAAANYQAKRAQDRQSSTETSRQALQDARRDLGNAVSSQVVSVAVFAGMTALWNLFRHREDKYADEETGEVTAASFFRRFLKDMLSSTAGQVPFGGEVYSAAAGLADKIAGQLEDMEKGRRLANGLRWIGEDYYGMESVTTQALTDAITAIMKTGDAVGETISAVNDEGPKRNAWLSWTEMAEDVSKLFGIPAENILNVGRASAQWVMQAAYGETLGDYYALAMTTKTSKKAPYYDSLWSACGKDRDACRTIYADMLELGFEADAISKAMEDRMKKELGVESVKALPFRWSPPGEDRDFDRIMDRAAKEGKRWTDLLPEGSMEAAQELDALGGDASKVEKVRKAAQFGQNIAEDQLESILSDKEWEQFRAARKAGFSVRQWADLYEDAARAREKRTGKTGGAPSQEDVRSVLDRSGLSEAKKKALWESYGWEREWGE